MLRNKLLVSLMNAARVPRACEHPFVRMVRWFPVKAMRGPGGTWVRRCRKNNHMGWNTNSKAKRSPNGLFVAREF
jgi:hypothetical protein